MINLIILTLEELRKLEKGEVVTCECKGIETKIICTDNFQDALTILELEENKKDESCD